MVDQKEQALLRRIHRWGKVAEKQRAIAEKASRAAENADAFARVAERELNDYRAKGL